ncbi:MAG: TlpA family protein disulfide reductase [Flavobacteriales bacterium]|nr:TlpA family protein disulfide reductase [Flavobacteriales bacterium]
MKKIILTLFCAFAATSFLFANPDDSTGTKSTLPSVTVVDLDGQNVNFAEFAANGQITIVSFWATWCKPCLVELSNVDNVYEEWQEKYNVRLIAVSIDDSRTVTKVKPMVNAKNWPYDFLIDGNSELRRAMNVTNPPTTFLLDKNGNIVFTHTGYLEGDEFELEEHIKKLAGQ